MGLKITLKPNERMILGGAVIRNGATKTELTVENNVPILRQKNIIGPDEANSPARRIYFAVQLMYVDEGHLAEHHKLYWALVKDFVAAAPSATGLVDRINAAVLESQYYDALKAAHKLIDYEKELLDRVQ